jgi:predicted transcriptional regulator of viral defense system
MVISIQGDTSYTGISRNESVLLGAVRKSGLPVFGVREAQALTGWEVNRVHNTLHTLETKDLVIRMKRGRYTLAEWMAEKLYEIATEAVKPSYISFWTALSHYGLTEQQPAVIQLVTVTQSGNFNIGPTPVELTVWLPGRFYGYGKKDGYVMADMEKALVDSLYQPEKCGGLGEYAKCLKNSWPSVNRLLFRKHLLRFGNRSVISRAGHLLDALGLEGLEGLEKHASKGYVRLDPGGGKVGRYDHRWKVMVNQEVSP